MNIVVYTKTGCAWCKGVVDLLNGKNISFEERNVTTNRGFVDELMKRSGQNKTPTLDIDGEILADSDKDQVTEFMKQKGVAGF
jgi:glutaredoxin 3